MSSVIAPRIITLLVKDSESVVLSEAVFKAETDIAVCTVSMFNHMHNVNIQGPLTVIIT